ncbi:MAG: hypothetical protein ACHQT9_02790 [Candidatus Saccharimonadales bacterium]
MRARNLPPLDAEDVLGEFTRNINEYASFAASDSAYMTVHAGENAMHGGIFAYASDAGLLILSAYPSPQEEARGMAGYHIVGNYPSTVGKLQKSSASRYDRESVGIIWQASKDLHEKNRHVLGGFVLMSTDEALTHESNTFLTPFVTRAIGEVLRVRMREEILAESEGIPEIEVDRRVAEIGREESTQELAMIMLAGAFPKPSKIHKAIGFKRRPKYRQQ